MPTDALPPEVQRELDAIDAALAGRPVDPELTELGALAVALREDRPAPPLAFASNLDRQVADGFRTAKVTRRRRWIPGTHVLAPVMVAALLAIVVVPAALMGGDDEAEMGSAGGGGEVAAPTVQEESADSASGAAEPMVQQLAPSRSAPVPPGPGGGSPGSDGRDARKVERSASLTLTAQPDEIQTVGGEVLAVADRNDGFVVSSSVDTSADGGAGNYLLRVPTPRLDTVMSELSQLASVTARSDRTQDITAEHSSARSRLQDARAERRSLLRRLARALTQTEVDSLKAQLRDVNARIAAARADLARVNNRAGYANVAVSLVADPEAAAAGDDGQWTPGDAAKDAVRVLEVIAGIALVALAIVLPLALLVLAGLVAARWSARRGRERALDAV